MQTTSIELYPPHKAYLSTSKSKQLMNDSLLQGGDTTMNSDIDEAMKNEEGEQVQKVNNYNVGKTYKMLQSIKK